MPERNTFGLWRERSRPPVHCKNTSNNNLTVMSTMSQSLMWVGTRRSWVAEPLKMSQTNKIVRDRSEEPPVLLIFAGALFRGLWCRGSRSRFGIFFIFFVPYAFQSLSSYTSSSSSSSSPLSLYICSPPLQTQNLPFPQILPIVVFLIFLN